MKTFKQYVAEKLEKISYREPRKLDAVEFHDKSQISNVPVTVMFGKQKKSPKRSYEVNFDINRRFHAPDANSDPGAWRDHEKVLSHLPSIMRHVKKSIESFATEKKPNQLHFQANDQRKTKLYRTFAQHLAKKHGGKVETRYNPGMWSDIPEYVVHLPGKSR